MQPGPHGADLAVRVYGWILEKARCEIRNADCSTCNSTRQKSSTDRGQATLQASGRTYSVMRTGIMATHRFPLYFVCWPAFGLCVLLV